MSQRLVFRTEKDYNRWFDRYGHVYKDFYGEIIVAGKKFNTEQILFKQKLQEKRKIPFSLSNLSNHAGQKL